MQAYKAILFASFIFFLTTSVSFAQTDGFTFEKAYQDYVFTQDTYKKAHSEYVLARNQYMQAQTLAAQSKAREATVKMLEARDDLVSTYLTALRMRLADSEVDQTDKNGLFTRIDSEVSWFKEHRGSIGSAGSLEDLEADSKEAADHFTKITEPLIYEILVALPIGKVESLRAQENNIVSSIKAKVEQIRNNNNHDVSLTERWITETENKITRSLDKQIEAQNLSFQLQPDERKTTQPVNRGNIYESIVKILQESHQFLKDASGFTKEIMRQIKTENNG